MSECRKERAIVLGGGMAGLLTAKVLSETYGQVLLVDRDQLTDATGPRRGVPQARHAHALLARGEQILDELFPGFTAELVSSGIPVGDLGGDLRWYFNGKRLAPASTGLISVSATRAVLEARVRTKVLGLPNVSVAQNRSIVGLRADRLGTRITGVRLSGEDGRDEELGADLVVDATGRGSRTPVWLTELGYQRPPEDRIKVNLAYTTRHYRLNGDPYGTDLSINPVASPENPRGAFFPKLADGTSMLSLTGMRGDHPPRDDEGFLAFAKTLVAPEIYEAIVDAESIDDPVTFRFPASVWRHYERLRRFPDGLLVIGDAVCGFNPVYGQGMTVAAMQAIALRDHLSEGGPMPRRFFRRIAPIINGPWEISASADLAFPGVGGKRTLNARLGNAYVSRLHTAAAHDARFTNAFFRVAGLIDPLSALMRPGLVFDVMRTVRSVGKQDSSHDPTLPLVNAAAKVPSEDVEGHHAA